MSQSRDISCDRPLHPRQARGEADNLDDLVAAGLLLRHEAAALAPLPSKAQVVWAWLTHFWSRALRGGFACSAVPCADTGGRRVTVGALWNVLQRGVL